MKGGGPCAQNHWGPCVHSIPIDGSKEKLGLVGLRGPTVLGCLHAKVPWFDCLPGCPFINGTGHSTGEGDVETPPPCGRGGGMEGCEMRDSTAELQIVLCCVGFPLSWGSRAVS